ncbi:phage tail tape measure protein [Siculibacillus lacustris]|uniref:Phage tail tape measure protein n=1 Tax=Siculibacillus lacustris TaxID=1549641 RepID=A0A4Q9VZR4_9HYPH|nr:phage tail tape measure protein [Siculibacillus lacustris]TBW40984.1 phage tail tape measure protein [Siculibacillus lacustris]
MADAESGDVTAATDTTQSLAVSLGSLDGLSKSFGRSLTAAFKGAAVQGKALDVVLRGIAERLSSKALDTALSPLTSLIASGTGSLLKSLGSALGFARGGVFAGGGVVPFASGGVVATPTYFPMTGGRTGLLGEAGPEAILPLARGADGRLGIATQGNGAGANVTFNVTTPDAASFRRAEAQVTGMLARAVGRGRRGL